MLKNYLLKYDFLNISKLIETSNTCTALPLNTILLNTSFSSRFKLTFVIPSRHCTVTECLPINPNFLAYTIAAPVSPVPQPNPSSFS